MICIYGQIVRNNKIDCTNMQKSESNALIFEKPMEGELRSLRMELSAEKKEEILYFVKNHNKLRFVDEYKEIQDQF